MPFSTQSYDPETLTALKDAFDMVWDELKLVPGLDLSDALRKDLAVRLMAAADRGTLDPLELKDRMVREFTPRQA